MKKMREPKSVFVKGFDDPEYIRIIANFKRFLEKWSLDADFREVYEQNSEKAIADSGLDVEPEAIKLMLDEEKARNLQKALTEKSLTWKDLPESYVLYRAFIQEKLSFREKLRIDLCAPKDSLFNAWRERQERRCWLEMGPSARSMVQAPLMFELSEGCSVGCPFCGIAAKGLCGIFRYSEEHAELWQDVLSRLHRLIGDAAGRGTCYYACEGLDNPDYERFIKDSFDEFGVVPQTTTAASTRNIERTKALLRFGKENDPHTDRFSVLSTAMRDQLFSSFSPEELLMVELLPQFPEAPCCKLTKVGRNRNDEQTDAVGGTIACASGFIVNMQEKSLRLMTPFVSDQKHPTGEWILEKCSFTSAEDLEEQVRRMMSQYMTKSLELNCCCKAACDFRLEEKEGRIWVYGHAIGLALMDTAIRQDTLDRMLALLREGTYTGYDILDALPEGTIIAHSILLLKLLWEHGLIDQSL